MIVKKLNIERVYADKASGKHMDRPQLKAMLEFAREGDTIVVESFSRLSRSTKDLLHLVDSMHAKGIAFESQKEKIDTSTPSGKLFLTIIAALNEFEREVLLERQAEGIAAAKARGVRFGRPPKPLPENFHHLYQQWKNGKITGTAAAKLCGMPLSTFRYRAEIYEKVKLL